jgi:hypothetical protein
MASSTGRTTEPKTVTIGTTSGSTALTWSSNAVTTTDVGRPVTGTGIPAGATLATRTNATSGTLSVNATATGSPSCVLGSGLAVSNNYGFVGWSPETDAEAAVYPIAAGAGASAPSVLADAVTRVNQRNR